MADLRKDPGFSAAVASARQTFQLLATNHRIPDAVAIHRRAGGYNNLQAHAHSIVPLAVLVARAYPGLLSKIRERTDLRKDMGKSGEGRDTLIWDPVAAATAALVKDRGADVVTETMSGNSPQTASRVARTYLSKAFGGGQVTGGGGSTVVKRMLKLLAHTQIE